MKSSLKTKIWLYVITMSRPRFRVHVHSIFDWLSRDSFLETGAKFKWHNGIQSLANGGVFIYELSSCGFESRCCHTINMKNHLDPRQVSFFDPLGFFSAFSQKIYCCHQQKENNTLETFSGISFFHVYEILLCKFCSRSMKSIEM